MLSTLQTALLALTVSLNSYQASISPPAVASATQTEERILEVFPDAPIMLQVAECESGARQFTPDGSVVKNPITPDYGIFQINKGNFGEAKRLGFDVFTLEGNIGYARYLYEQRGLHDWMASSKCWSHSGSKANLGDYETPRSGTSQSV